MYSINFQSNYQALQKELERQLSEKDKEIAALKSENDVGWMYTWHQNLHDNIGVGGISIYLVNFGVYWIPNIIGGLNRDTEIPNLFGFTWYELHL